LREVIESKGHLSEDGPVSFLLNGVDALRLSRVSAVFCKELLLSGTNAVYVSSAYLHQICSYYARHGECEDLSGLNDKYLVVPDLFDNNWYPDEHGRRLVYVYLRSHYYRGAGLTICTFCGPHFGDIAFDDFVEGFKTLEVL